MASERRWGLGLGLALALLVVHLGVWRPARDAFVEHVAYPLATAVETERAEAFVLLRAPRTITAERIETGATWRYQTPANLEFLIVALVLVAAFPRRLYWLWLWGAHLGLGVVVLGAFLVGLGWGEGGFVVSEFLQDYVAQGLNLLALVAAFAPRSLPSAHRSSGDPSG